MADIEFYKILNSLTDEEVPEWALGLTDDQVNAMIDLADFVAKADEEGGFETVIDNWPGLVPDPLRAAADEYRFAMERWREHLNWYMKHCGVRY